jgi:hypothetical protein
MRFVPYETCDAVRIKQKLPSFVCRAGSAGFGGRKAYGPVDIAMTLIVPLPDGSGRAGGPGLAQIIFVSSGELPCVVDIIGKVHHFDFVAFIQRLPKLVFTE